MKKNLALALALAAVLTACGSIEAGSPAFVSVFSKATTLTVGDTLTLKVYVLDPNDNVVVDAKPTFTSSDGSIVGVDANGKLTATGPGSASVTASVDGISNSVGLNVVAKP